MIYLNAAKAKDTFKKHMIKLKALGYTNERIRELLRADKAQLAAYGSDTKTTIPPLATLQTMVNMIVDMSTLQYAISGQIDVEDIRVGDFYFGDRGAASDYAFSHDIYPFAPSPRDKLGNLRHRWRLVYFDGLVPHTKLAEIAGVDAYDAMWIGREHPSGIQPTEEQVLAAEREHERLFDSLERKTNWLAGGDIL